MTDAAMRQIERDLRVAVPGDLNAFSAWLFAELRAGAQGIPRSGRRTMFALRLRRSPDKVRRTEIKQYGPGKARFAETIVRSLMCHPWPTSVRQAAGATSPYWAVSLGGLSEDRERGWAGLPGDLYLSPVLERGTFRFMVWYRERDSIHFRDPQELVEYLGPQHRRGWEGQQRLVDWVFADQGDTPCR